MSPVRRHPGIGWALIVAGVSTAPTASAASLNARSDHVALNAYRAYLQSLVSITPAWRRTAAAYVSSISGQCPHVLRSLKNAQPGTFSETALVRFGNEAGGDLDAATYPHGRRAAPATRQFVTKYAHRISVVDQDGTSFLTVLKRYSTAPESGTVTKINHLLERWGATIQNRLVPEGKKLLTALGI